MTDDLTQGNDIVARAQRDYDRERAALMVHAQQCRWCLVALCPMGTAVKANAEAFGRHLDTLVVADTMGAVS